MDVVQQIKERLEIVDLLRTYLNLLPAGKNFKALCPFHKEKTPSFIVSPERQLWHCFGCGAGGDIVGFLMKYENLEFLETLKVLAEKAGVDFKTSGSADHKEYDRLYQINQTARDFFKNVLVNSQAAKNYFKDRGLKDETIQEFELGFAPDGVDNLTRHLIKFSYQMADIERAGLAFKTERGIYCDRFRNRLMFPLHNSFGKVVGFTGRIMPGSEREGIGKYVNSPETPIFNKSKLLFGFHKSKNAIRDLQCAVLVEGQMDFLMVWQDGVKNSAATSGTALTADHLKLLRRATDALIISFDNDEAGQAATERTIDSAQQSDFNVRVVSLSAKDPADIVRDSPGLMTKLVSEAKSAMDYYFGKYEILNVKNNKLAAPEAKKNLRAVLAKIKDIYSAVERAHWLKKLANISGVDERFLLEEMAALKFQKKALEAEELKNYLRDQILPRRDLIAQRLLSLVSLSEDLGPRLREFYNYLPATYQKVLDSPGQAGELATLISLRASLGAASPEAPAPHKEFSELLRQLKLECLREKREQLALAIKEAEEKKDQERLIQALREFDNLSREMQDI